MAPENGDGAGPRGGRDEFDHFFTDRDARAAGGRDPDATAWAQGPYDDPNAGDPGYDDRTHAAPRPSYDDGPAADDSRHSYVQPPRSDEDYYGYEQGPYYGEQQQQPRRRGNVWAPVLVIVASLLVVGVIAAIALSRSGSDGGQANPPLPTQTVTKTQTQSPSEQSQSSTDSPSSPSDQSNSTSNSSSPSSSESSPSYATALPGSATPCPGTADYGAGPRTTCAFAAVVAGKYASAKDGDGNASFSATSPETRKSYDVTCTAGDVVTCVTTTNATIYLLRK